MITQWHIDQLLIRIEELEKENVGTTNALYEMENRLQSQLDALINHMMAPDEIFLPNDVM